MMKRLLLTSLFLSSLLLADPKPVPNGPLKVFRGPEGELIGMVEVNKSKAMLVHFKNLGGEFEGQSKLYQYADNGRDNKEVFFNYHWRKSKIRPWVVLASHGGTWEFANPTEGSTQHFKLTFSQADTDKLKLEDVLKAYNPKPESK